MTGLIQTHTECWPCCRWGNPGVLPEGWGVALAIERHRPVGAGGQGSVPECEWHYSVVKLEAGKSFFQFPRVHFSELAKAKLRQQPGQQQQDPGCLALDHMYTIVVKVVRLGAAVEAGEEESSGVQPEVLGRYYVSSAEGEELSRDKVKLETELKRLEDEEGQQASAVNVAFVAMDKAEKDYIEVQRQHVHPIMKGLGGPSGVRGIECQILGLTRQLLITYDGRSWI